MKIVSTNEKNILKAVEIVKNGGIIVFPTDTVYGIGCDLRNDNAVNKIYSIKGRPASMPLIAMFGEIYQYRQLTTDCYPDAEMYMHKWWPGALTIILPAIIDLPSRVLAGGNTIGMRIPAHSDTFLLLRHLNIVLATTSANKSGMKSPITAEEAVLSLGRDVDVDMVLDSGSCPGGIPSTLLDCTKNPPEILRQGEITADMLKI